MAGPVDGTPSRGVGPRNERVMENQGLVRQVARGFRGRGVELEDLVQFGNLGLLRAAEKFEPGRGLRFSTYATYWIRQAISNGIADTSRPIRVPLHARQDAAAVHRRAKAMEEETGTKPWLTEVLDAMEARGDSSPAKRGRLLRAAEADVARFFGIKPLEEVGGEGRPEDSPPSVTIDREHREQLGLALGLLCEEHRRVLTCRYGLDGSPPLEAAATAARLGVACWSVPWTERAAIAALRGLLLRPHR